MKKIILIILIFNFATAGNYYNICKADRRRLIHLNNNKNQTIRNKNKEIQNLSIRNRKLMKDLKWYKSKYSKIKGIEKKFSKQIKKERIERYYEKKQAKDNLNNQINNKQKNKLMKPKIYLKDIKWYKNKYEECKAAIEVN